MYLSDNQLFDNRYRLVRRLGSGASAEVWLAVDTAAAGLKVAVKILSARQGMDTYGMQNFQREFTSVFNIKHQNLLTPSNYAVCNGIPYLVMPYLENGSVQNIVGRSDENDAIRFLHDVASGLACLHAHNIVHQDIKPDNILLDSDCNFLVTDFGISIASGGTGRHSSGAGTRAYMSPERFSNGARATDMSDVWSMGATVYEMLSGDAPFGDNGGIVQGSGEKVPELSAKYQPELRNLIMKCLDANPTKRPTAEEVAKLTGRYLETGDWKEKNGRKQIMMIVSGLLFALLLGILYYVDYNRTKVYYYKDYCEVWAVPQGIGRLTGSEMRHRNETYRFEYSKHKLQRISLVNGRGKIVRHSDSELVNSRDSEAKFYYTADGKVDYKIVYDQCGKVLYKMDYDENMNTVTFRLNDKYGTEMFLSANTTDLSHSSSAIEQKSGISRYLLTFDENGMLLRLNYVGPSNVPRGDDNNVYGREFEYDYKGRIIVERFLGADEKLTCNKIGLAIKEFAYDDEDNNTLQAYYNADHKSVDDGNGASVYKYTHDKYGNRLTQTHWTSEDEPTVLKGTAIYGYRYTYDDYGCHVKTENIDKDGNLMYNRYGFCATITEYNEDGFEIKETFIDDKGKAVSAQLGDNSFAIVVTKPNQWGQTLESCVFDEFNNPIENSAGYHKTVNEYDSIGNLTLTRYFDKAEKATKNGGFEHSTKLKFDEFNRLVEVSNYDENDKPTQSSGGAATIKVEYNRQGAVTKVATYGKEGKLQAGSNLYAYVTYEYDERGNEVKHEYFDANGKLCMCSNGYATVVNIYDPKTNFITAFKDYDTSGKLVAEVRQKVDSRGNVVERYVLDENGVLRKNSVVTKSKYDNNNNQIEEWYTDLASKPVNYPGAKYAKVKYKYDERGNNIESSWWDTNGKAATHSDGTHRWIKEFDNLDQLIHDVSFDAIGNPITSKDGYAENKYEYDMYGHNINHTVYDGHGKPVNGFDGWHSKKSAYNKRGRTTQIEYLDVDGKLVNSKENEWAKSVYAYDDNNNNIESKRYDKDSKCTMIEKYKYNKQNRQTEVLICDGDGNENDDKYGFSKMTISYEESGVVPKEKKYFNKKGQLLASCTYNTSKQDWNDLSYTSAAGAGRSVSYSGSSWIDGIRAAAAACPFQRADGLVITSISYSSSSVTFYMKLTGWSMYEMDDDAKEGIRSALYSEKSQLRKDGEIPSSVSITISYYDKAGRYIGSV